MTEAIPMAMPPRTRQAARSHAANGRPEPTALTANSTAAICMTRMRPMRSAMRPAIAAPRALPSRALAATVPVTPELRSNRAWMPPLAPLMTELS